MLPAFGPQAEPAQETAPSTWEFGPERAVLALLAVPPAKGIGEVEGL